MKGNFPDHKLKLSSKKKIERFEKDLLDKANEVYKIIAKKEEARSKDPIKNKL